MSTMTSRLTPNPTSGVSYTLTDTVTLLRRNMLRIRRYPSMTLMMLFTPIILLVMFDYFFGGALQGSIGTGGPLGGHYVNYLVPGLILMIPAFMIVSVAVLVADEMTKGIVNRFRTMSISPSAILGGHAVSALVQAAISLAVLLGVGLLIGFRPTAGALGWLGAIGMLLLTTFAFVWLAIAFGLVAKTPASASNLPTPITMLPYLGSGLVPTDGMPAGVRQFAEYQPFSPIAETVRGLLMGTYIGNSGWLALAWCAVIGLGGFVWSTRLFATRINS